MNKAKPLALRFLTGLFHGRTFEILKGFLLSLLEALVPVVCIDPAVGSKVGLGVR